ncbi:MAG TPA: SRPBCC family protein [Solirubrobacteraceae bacterium]|jgi:carbon monoxide dehydrogenase subunit G|nr:SRPBCC family protein [Solirubrobacteraceae bacterium]
MPRARRTRTLGAAPEQVWDVIADPHHFPRWWPGVTRMEGVQENRWTQVFLTRKGHTVRVDFRLLESEAPGAGGGSGGAGRRRWEQELIGSPFERMLRQAITEVRLEPADPGTRVMIEQRQKLRGYSRLVGPWLRRAARTRLEEALDGLERTCG